VHVAIDDPRRIEALPGALEEGRRLAGERPVRRRLPCQAREAQRSRGAQHAQRASGSEQRAARRLAHRLYLYLNCFAQAGCRASTR
jgi:hypothetical protein